jgi:alanine racemase
VAALRLMTHLARADENDGLAEPLAVFDAATRGLPYPRSVANSAGVFRYAEVGGDLVRPGIMLYGATPFAVESAEQLGLAPAMTLRSALIAVQQIAPNDSVGYGGAYTASRTHRIGVVACGYADGYPRHAANGTPVLVAGRKTRLAGRVSMDMMTVDVTNLGDVQPGDEVVILGRQGNESWQQIDAREVAAAIGTIPWEIVCRLGTRVERQYTDS